MVSDIYQKTAFLLGSAEVTGLAFFEQDPSVLYIRAEGKVYKRKLKVEAAPVNEFLEKLSGWGAG